MGSKNELEEVKNILEKEEVNSITFKELIKKVTDKQIAHLEDSFTNERNSFFLDNYERINDTLLRIMHIHQRAYISIVKREYPELEENINLFKSQLDKVV